MKRFLIAVVVLAAAMCQAQLGTTTQIRRGSTLPTTCGGGDIFIKSGASSGFYFNVASGTCSWVGPAAVAGLSDPGSNGIVKRTALNTTAAASASDVAGLFSGCSGTQYLGADGACHSATAAGLADPGSNGIVKRTALNTTAAAASSDVIGLWSGSCSSSTYLRGDGACSTPAGGGSIAFTTLTDGSTVTWTVSGSPTNATLTLVHTTSTRALNLSVLTSGASGVLILRQDSTGGAALTLGTGCTWVVGGSGGGVVSLSSAANAVDVLAFVYDGTYCYANFRPNFN